MDDLGKIKTKTAPTLNIDWEVYAQSLEDSGMSEQEKQEYIEIIWSIVVGFVDMGFGVHPVQQACEKEVPSSKQAIDNKLLSSPDDVKTKFNSATKCKKNVLEGKKKCLPKLKK